MRDKEEELENSLTKIDNLRQDIRKAEKLRRELEVRAEEAFTETTKERKAREKAEVAATKAEAEVERLKVSNGGGGVDRPLEESSEVARLVAEMDKAEIDHSAAMDLSSARHQQELSALALQLEAAEVERVRVQAEVEQVREKREMKKNQDLQESDDVVVEIRNLHEREKALLMEENQKLSAELERSLEISTRLQADRRHLEDEYADLQGKKETVAQWENQIAEIIQWVSDEKDARGYLQVTTCFPQFNPTSPTGPCREADGGDGGGEDHRRPAGQHTAGEELEEQKVTEAGQDGLAGAAEQPAVGDPGKAGHQRGAEQSPSGARGEQEVSPSSNLPYAPLMHTDSTSNFPDVPEENREQMLTLNILKLREEANLMFPDFNHISRPWTIACVLILILMSS